MHGRHGSSSYCSQLPRHRFLDNRNWVRRDFSLIGKVQRSIAMLACSLAAGVVSHIALRQHRIKLLRRNSQGTDPRERISTFIAAGGKRNSSAVRQAHANATPLPFGMLGAAITQLVHPLLHRYAAISHILHRYGAITHTGLSRPTWPLLLWCIPLSPHG